MARAVQFFAPGIPQVYYVGLLAGKNDLKLLEETKVGRNINRHYYTKEEIDAEVKRPVVAELLRMMEFRNSHPAFDGTFELETCDDDKLVIVRKKRAMNGQSFPLILRRRNLRSLIQRTEKFTRFKDFEVLF